MKKRVLVLRTLMQLEKSSQKRLKALLPSQNQLRKKARKKRYQARPYLTSKPHCTPMSRFKRSWTQA